MLNKSGRAKLAKETVSNFIPHVLKTNARAQKGINSSELVHYVLNQDLLRSGSVATAPADAPTSTSASSIPKSQATAIKDLPEDPEDPVDKKKPSCSDDLPAGMKEPINTTSCSNPVPPTLESPPLIKIRVIQSDTYDAVHALLSSPISNSKSFTRVAALNMASSYTPGGGFLNGAFAQEETLCMRSTLYYSLSSSYYRIPELCAIYSPDILVFRSSDMKDLSKPEWFYTDVISVAALKQPELKFNADKTKMIYEYEQDRELMMDKIRLIFQVAREKGVNRLCLGAIGCGAYRNPPEEVANMFRKVILGTKKRRGVEGFEEIIFAIFDDGPNLKAFKEVFEDVMEK
ncbi:hypothetical protein EG329_010542 [Mollisiaceae sp. DMI_Dod_QoI]|nr:hypothetical protein EG329_010542 [Helotiales sp. DMI_Dod_QoI]